MTKISTDLKTKVLTQLGFSEPIIPNIQNLQRIYSSWCYHIPFDNLRKMIALKSSNSQKLPGLDAYDFFENWLENGAGATCWPMANALYELLISIGFDAKRITGNMRDLGVVNHGSLVVFLGGQSYLVEASLLLNKIFILDQETKIDNDIILPTEIEKEGDSHLLWLVTPPGTEFYYCRIDSKPVDYSDFENGYEASRILSIFNKRLYVRRNYLGKLVILWGNAYYSKTMNGIEYRELTRDEIRRTLQKEIGISEKLVNEWVNSGGLEASLESYSGPKPPPIKRKSPSQRLEILQNSNEK